MKIVHRKQERRVAFHQPAPARETIAKPPVVAPSSVPAHFVAPPSRKSIVDDVLKILRKAPQEPLDFITLKYATDLNESLVGKVARDQKEALSKYQVAAPVQYVFMQHQSASASASRPVDGQYQINICEVFYWPVKATIVSAHVNHSSSAATTLRMYSILSQNTRTELGASDVTPYAVTNLKIEVPADTKIWFSLSSSAPLPSATLVLGVIFHPIDLVASSLLN